MYLGTLVRYLDQRRAPTPGGPLSAPTSFDHRAHLRLAWSAIARGGLAAALAEVPAWLRDAAVAAGRPDRYHETVTVGFLLLVADRYREGEEVDAFLQRNPDLL